MKKIILIIILGLLVYSNAFSVNFLWDDVGLVANNPLIKQLKSLPRVFTTGIFVGEVASKNFYRPVQALTNMFDFFIYKDNPAGFHFTNILLHIICALLLYYFFRLIFKKDVVAYLSALLFLVHSINVETVTYISGRADSLALLFLLLSFISYVYFRQIRLKRFLTYSVVSFAFAIFSKELALSAIFIYVLIDYVLDKDRRYGYYAIYLSIGIIFFILRFFVLGLHLAQTNFSVLSRILTFIVSISDYLKLLAFPVNLHMSYTTKIFSYFNPILILRLISVCLFFILFFYLLKPAKKVYLFCVSWFFIFLLPQSGIIPINAYFAEHFVYLSEYALFFIVVFALNELCKGRLRIIFYSAFLIIIIALSLATFSYTKVWSDPVKFYRRIIFYSPNSFAAYNNLGSELEKRGEVQAARRQYLIALSIYPKDTLSFNNLGKSYLNEGQFDKAIGLFKQAMKIEPKKSVLHYNLAMAYESAGNLPASLVEYERAFKLAKEVAPWDASIYFKLGLLYYKTGKIDSAIEEFKTAMRLDPGDPATYVDLGLCFKAQGLYQKAVFEYLKALKIDPNFAQTYNNLGVIYAETGDRQSALKYFSRAIELNDKYDEARFNLGLLYLEMHNFKRAKEQLALISNEVSFYSLVQEQLKKIK